MPTWRSFLLGVGGDWDLEIGAAAAACMAGCMAEGGAAALKPKFECIDNDDGGEGGGEKMGFAESWPSMKPLTHSPELDAAPGTGTDEKGPRGTGRNTVETGESSWSGRIFVNRFGRLHFSLCCEIFALSLVHLRMSERTVLTGTLGSKAQAFM